MENRKTSLVVVGYCLRVNSSANLCHLSYIRGLIDSGYAVDLLTVREDGQDIDESMIIPRVVNVYSYPSSLYERISNSKRKIQREAISEMHVEVASKVKHGAGVGEKIKGKIRALYGIYGVDQIWCNNACNFRSDKEYDIVISLAYPPISHVLVKKLIRKNRIRYQHWIQIWEDPWASDLFGCGADPRIIEEERKILESAEKVCYVSPLTLYYQKQMFPESAHKMYWQPLPAYYESAADVGCRDYNFYGYFGDFAPSVRNLECFYEAAIKEKIHVNICGNPTGLFASKENVKVYPRMPLNELAVIEKETNVLVFLCNLRGGQIPGKIYQYSATSKPILFILDGTEDEKKVLKDYFETFERYIFCENTIQSICEGIERIEQHQWGTVKNRAVTEFRPDKIIENIIREGSKG